MRYYAPTLISSLVALSALACGSAPADAAAPSQTQTSALATAAATDAVAPLVALAAPSSDGRAALTAA